MVFSSPDWTRLKWIKVVWGLLFVCFANSSDKTTSCSSDPTSIMLSMQISVRLWGFLRSSSQQPASRQKAGERMLPWGKAVKMCARGFWVVFGNWYGEKAIARSLAHTGCQGLCRFAPVKILHVGQQLQLESSPDYSDNNPQSLSKIHLPSV